MAHGVVVYATRTGNAGEIAGRIASLMATEAVRIEDKVNRNGIIGYIRAGFHATTGKATPIGDPGVDLSKADTVVLVQPIWASKVMPPLRTWLRAHASELEGKKLGLFTVCKGSDAESVRRAFEAEFRKLGAFGNVKEHDDGATRQAACKTFVAALG